jgi:SAM-dependent methyltransferase
VDDPKQIVERGWDAVAERFAEWQRAIRGSERLERLDDLLRRVPARPDVLELGSGAGVRSTRMLAEGGRLTGVDISAEQIRRARERIPEARFVHGDVMAVELAPEAFDAVVSFYVLNNLPREQLGPLFGRVHGWLRPGGWFLASLPAEDNPGWRGDWLGVEMFFSGYDTETTLGLVRGAGFELVEHSIETMLEPDWADGRVGSSYAEISWLWVLARKPASR